MNRIDVKEIFIKGILKYKANIIILFIMGILNFIAMFYIETTPKLMELFSNSKYSITVMIFTLIAYVLMVFVNISCVIIADESIDNKKYSIMSLFIQSSKYFWKYIWVSILISIPMLTIALLLDYVSIYVISMTAKITLILIVWVVSSILLSFIALAPLIVVIFNNKKKAIKHSIDLIKMNTIKSYCILFVCIYFQMVLLGVVRYVLSDSMYSLIKLVSGLLTIVLGPLATCIITSLIHKLDYVYNYDK